MRIISTKRGSTRHRFREDLLGTIGVVGINFNALHAPKATALSSTVYTDDRMYHVELSISEVKHIIEAYEHYKKEYPDLDLD